MGDLIKNVNDPNFKSVIQKLLSAEWLAWVIDTPKTESATRCFEFQWSVHGQMCITSLIAKRTQSPYRDEAWTFVDSLTEQEEAYFQEIFLDAFPRDLVAL
jgi:hypothetical protein